MGSIWWTRRAVGLHVTVIVLEPTFLGLGWWQLHRALSGNELSWAYTIEWPIFAAYGIVLWWRLVHEQGEESPRGRPTMDERRAAKQRAVDAELTAYNAYLRSLNEEDELRRFEAPPDEARQPAPGT